MKHIKVLSLVLAFVLLLALLPACSSEGDAIEFLCKKLKGSDNYEMTLAFEDLPILGDSSVTVKRDGKKTYLADSISGLEQYAEEKDGKLTLYTESEDGYVKSETDANELKTFLSKSDFDTLFDAENYVYSEENGIFDLKDGISLEGLSNVSLKIIGGGCVISATISYGGISSNASITVKGIGTTEITLPE